MTLNAGKILTSAEKFHINLGLSRTLDALNKLGNPQNFMHFIHVAGTNGKGSVCAMLNEILCTHFKSKNVNIGLFTSPHLFSYTERIKVNNKNISSDELDKYVNMAAAANSELTEFEILTVAAFKYFKDKNVKYVTLETGLGGRYDSTNIITKTLCSVITTIDFDHTARLGTTINEIAYQKAGIIKKSCPVIISKDNLGLDTVKQYAKTLDAPLFLPKDNIRVEFDGKDGFAFINDKRYNFSLIGDYQAKNLSLVIETLKHLPFEINEDELKIALKNVLWRFRLEYHADKKLLIDGAHNQSGIKVLREFLDKYFPNEKKTFIFGCLNNKNWQEMLKILLNKDDEFYFFEFNYPNALKYNELPKDLKSRAHLTFNPAAIINETKNLKIVCGSLYMEGILFNPR